MSYRDIQMIIASQIAYIDFNRDAVDSGQYTVNELLEMELERPEADKKDVIQKLLDRIAETPAGRECGNWKVRDIRDNQSSSGMYACLLDSGDGNALVAFRGSESESWDDIQKDWIQSDIGLANSILTPQQATAEQYIRDIYRKYGGEYDNFGLTGHSLGGNLAEHAAITAPDGMRDKIGQCVNLDGPGFSNKYLAAHANDIEKSKGIITHYQWSWCGGLLNRVPGSDFRTIEAKTPEGSNLLESMLWRHDTYNIVNFDENGNAVPGKKDWFASLADPLSQVLDYTLFLFTGAGIAVIYNSIDSIRDGFENLWKQWTDILSAGGRQVQFELNTNAVDGEIEDLAEIGCGLNDIRDSVERIQRELAFDSIAAGYVKLKLWGLANSIEQDARKIDTYCRVGKDCTQCYKAFEQKIVDNYG